MNANRLERLAEEWRRRAEERAEEGALLDGEKLYMKVAAELETALEEHKNESLTVAEAAEESGYSEDSLREMVRDGPIPDPSPPGSQSRISIKRKHLPRKPPAAEPRDLEAVKSLEELGLDRREAAHALGVSPSTVRHWLSGRHAVPTPAAKLLRLWVRRSDLRPSVADDVAGEEVLR